MERTRLRIALTADPVFPVPPRYYGGIERVVDMVARGLVERGHDVTLFAHPDSTTAGRLVPFPWFASGSWVDLALNAATLARHVYAGQFDVIHSFSRVAYMTPVLPLPIPKLMSYGRMIARRSIRLGQALSHGTLWFSAVSRYHMREVEDVGTWRLVFNGVPLASYDFRPDPGPDAPLMFLGRIEELKGTHLAIEVARRVGMPLVIAGNLEAEHRAFFDAEIAPHIDGSQVVYLGAVDDEAKNELLGRARALIFPTLLEEPFGLVMTEAMACGTPVIGLARCAVPEIVEHGMTGYLADDVEGMVGAVENLDKIDRAACRARVERMFSDQAVVDTYESVYAEMLAAARSEP